MIGSLWISNFLMALMSWGSWFWKWIFVGASLLEEHLPLASGLYQKRLPTILHPKLPFATRMLQQDRGPLREHAWKTSSRYEGRCKWSTSTCEWFGNVLVISRGNPSVCWNYHDLTANGQLSRWRGLSSPDALTLPKGTFRGSSPAISAMQQSKGNPTKNGTFGMAPRHV